jgi:hypothetical protein
MKLALVRLSIVILALSFLPGAVQSARGQAGIQIVESRVDYDFARQVTILASLQSEVPILLVTAYLRGQNESQPRSQTTLLDAQGDIVVMFDLADQPLRAFTRVDYWFVIIPQEGEAFASQTFSFTYDDDRFDWQTQVTQPFRVHWYEPNPGLGAAAIDIAQKGLQRIQTLLPVETPDEVNIYVYASAQEMQNALRLGGIRWVAGHADPELGLMVVSLPPGAEQSWEMARQIPHELMHIMLFAYLGEAYRSLPVWLNEGLASAAELNPNPDYDVILNKARQKDALLPLADLCQSFPLDASGAFLAYAESFNFVYYLYDRYQAEGLQALANSYANGLDCDQGAEQALGVPLSQLEIDWRQEALGENPLGAAVEELLPWSLLCLAATLAPLGLTLAGLRRKILSGKGPVETSLVR